MTESGNVTSWFALLIRWLFEAYTGKKFDSTLIEANFESRTSKGVNLYLTRMINIS